MSLMRVQPAAPSLESVAMDQAELRSVLGFFPSGIAASCAAADADADADADAEPVGLVATSEVMAMTGADAVGPRFYHRSTIHRGSTPSLARCLS